MKKTLAIVLVEFNNRDQTLACIKSIRSNTFKNVQIIVIDNSTYSEPFNIEQHDIHYEKQTDNIGFCAGCNAGVQVAKNLQIETTLILNYDTHLRTDCLEILMNRFNQLPEFSVVSGKIYYDSDRSKIWYAGGRLSLLQGVGKHIGKNKRNGNSNNRFREVSYLSGCCMLAATDTFFNLGPFNPNIFMYLDDAEFCLRAKQSGAHFYYEPQAVLFHSLGPGDERSNYSPHYLYFSIRNKPRITSNPLYRSYLYFHTCLLAISKILYYSLNPKTSGKREKVTSLFWGLLDAFYSGNRYRQRLPRLFKGTSKN